MAVSKEDLFKARLVQDDVEVPGINGTFRIRSLSRQEVLDFRKRKTENGTPFGEDPAAMERAMVAAALVEPALTEDEVGRWQAASTVDELEDLTQAIATLSGMHKGATKEAIKRFRK